MIHDDCDLKLGEKSSFYNKLNNVLGKILNEVRLIHL
jgi:hypothetical protein